MIRISAVIISFNEEPDIGRCLESVTGVADEVLVLDSFSTDGTEAVCRKFGVKFVQHAFDGYGSQKNRALHMASHDYILSLDADEALSEEAKNEVRRIKEEWTHDGYLFNRRNNYCGHWMRFTTWYPDRKLRLFDRRKAEWAKLDVHEYVQMTPGSRVGRIRGDLLHWTVRSIQDHQAKTEHFARISANLSYEKGVKPVWISTLIRCAWHWFREYCLHVGILDGKAGWQVARFSALYAWRKYSYLRDRYASQRP